MFKYYPHLFYLPLAVCQLAPKPCWFLGTGGHSKQCNCGMRQESWDWYWGRSLKKAKAWKHLPWLSQHNLLKTSSPLMFTESGLRAGASKLTLLCACWKYLQTLKLSLSQVHTHICSALKPTELPEPARSESRATRLWQKSWAQWLCSRLVRSVNFLEL